MSISQVLGAVFLVGAAAFFALYVTYRYMRRLASGERGPKSFGAWLRDLIDVIFGLG
jgi:hypothetical protein